MTSYTDTLRVPIPDGATLLKDLPAEMKESFDFLDRVINDAGNQENPDLATQIAALRASIDARFPFAEAAGTFQTPALEAGAIASVTIDLPVSRFTVSPVLTFESGEARVSVGIQSRSATQIKIIVANLTNAASSAVTGHWTARQMKRTAAAG